MTTEAQIEANRVNAQKSTGPKTPEGKAKVAQNAVRHGLLARQVVVVGEETDEFDLYRDQLRADLAPVGMVESVLVERIAGLCWRLRRAERFHTEAFDVLYAQRYADPQVRRKWPDPGPEHADPIFGVTVVQDFSETKVLERLLGYERRIENSLYRTMAELRKVQGLRQGAGGVPGTREKEIVRGTHPTDLPWDNLPAAITALEGTPAGATTNLPEAQSQLCETKPICAGEEVGRGRPTHAEGAQTREDAFGNPETPYGGTASASADLSCGTKPISEGGSSVKRQVPGETCQTNPISGAEPLGRCGFVRGGGHGPLGTKSLSVRGGSGILMAQASGVRLRNLAWGSPLGAAE